ncbi:MAG TPA: FAD-dependent monooxygenase [Bacteroidia bacterium]|nr:FAD-dependent monooxygenase [Bacteroidia bacterium]
MDIGTIHDYIVVGSGCTGAMAAQTLVEKGVTVLMLDAGETDTRYSTITPKKGFTDIRKTDNEQYKYWLGENFEGIHLGKTTTGAQLTPARKYILRNTDKLLPLISETFLPMESLSYGGLGNAWGLGCCVFSDKELEAAGLPIDKMKEAYQSISDRIGISAENDDATPYTSSGIKNLQKPNTIDNNSDSIYKKYKINKEKLNKKGFYMGRPALALLTEKKGEREAVNYNEMDFYSDNGAAYRPSITVTQLKKNSNFQYLSNALVLSFSNENELTTITYLDTSSNEKKTIKCKKLILCAGTLSTARIVLRSMGNSSQRLPLLCNPYKYFTLLQPSLLGKLPNEERTAFAQLALYHNPAENNFNVGAASIYSYHSLMLFRTIKEVSLGFREGRKIMQLMLPAMSVMGVHHPDTYSNNKYIELVKDNYSSTGDHLKAEYILSSEEQKQIVERETQYSATMRKLGCYTVKKINPGYGASIHYAGCLPFSETDKAYHLSSDGRLHGTKNIYVADGSGFNYLPAKGITLSIMAYAHLTALNSLSN